MLLHKIRDFLDTKINMFVVCKDVNDARIFDAVLEKTDRSRILSEAYRYEGTKGIMIEVEMPYNRYLAFMKNLQASGYKLKQESEIGMVNKLIKND